MFGTGSENEEFYNDIEFAKSTISGSGRKSIRSNRGL